MNYFYVKVVLTLSYPLLLIELHIAPDVSWCSSFYSLLCCFNPYFCTIIRLCLSLLLWKGCSIPSTPYFYSNVVVLLTSMWRLFIFFLLCISCYNTSIWMAQLPTPYLSPIKSQKNGDKVLTEGCQLHLGQHKKGL